MDTEWTDGTSGQLHGKFKVVKIVGGEEKECDGNDDYSVVNLPGNSMFKQLELYIGDTNVIDQSTSLYHYKAFTESLLSFGSDAKNTILQTALMFKDWPKDCTQIAKVANDKTSGYQNRKNYVEKSQVVPFCTCLHIDFLQCPRLIKKSF